MKSPGTHRMRGISAVVLAVVLSGCAIYRPAVLPGGVAVGELAEMPPTSSVDYDVMTQVGSDVRVVLKDGEIVTGEVVRITDREMVVGKTGNYGFEERVIDTDAIAVLEARKSPLGANVAFGSFGAVVLGFIALAAALAVGTRTGSN